jgi:pilus assembly protein CpaE
MGEAGGQRERPAALAEKVPAVEPHQAREAPLVKAGLPEASQAGQAVRAADAAPILTVSSGRGGVGKTALVALMASVAAHWGMDVAVVDLDLSCGNLHVCFGVPTAPDITRIVVDGQVSEASMGRASVRCAEHLHLWGPCERPEMAELVMPHVATLLSYLSARYDLVLVDTSTTFTDAVAQAVQGCDRMLVVHDERAGAVASAARMSALAVRLGVARTRIVRVVDLADPRAKPSVFEGRAEVGLETARMHRVVDGGIEAEELLSSGKVSEVVGTDSSLALGVASLLAQTLAELGRLPNSEAARKAAEGRTRRHGLRLFGGQRREAV